MHIYICVQVKKFYMMMGVEPDKLRLHLDVWGVKKLFSNAVRRWGVCIGNRKVPRASPQHFALYSVLLALQHWNKVSGKASCHPFFSAARLLA